MKQELQVAVIGASGFVATNVRKFLAENNVKLISISRTDFNKFKNETKIITKTYDDKTLATKLAKSDVLIHLVGIGKQTVDTSYNLVNTEFTKKIVDLCKKSKIKKIIYSSGLGVSKNTTMGYFISKYKAERHIIESNLDYTIFRPSYIVGKNDLLTKYLKKQIKNAQIQIPGSGKYHIQPIYIDDVCKIIFKALTDNNFNKKTLDLVGPEIFTFERYIKEFSRDTKCKIRKMDLETIYHHAISNPRSEFGVDDLNLLIGDFIGDYKKLKNISKINFCSIHEILKSGKLL